MPTTLRLEDSTNSPNSLPYPSAPTRPGRAHGNGRWYLAALISGLVTLAAFLGMFQPVALGAYGAQGVARSTAMSLDIEQKYGAYAGESEGLIPGQALQSTAGSCGTGQTYRGYAEHLVVLERIETNTSIDTTLETVPRVYGLADATVASLHAQNYETYQGAFGYLRDHQETLENVLGFLQHRNEWIEACQTILESLRNAPVLAACERVRINGEGYIAAGNPVGRSQVQTLLRKCTETTSAGYNYSAAWLREYLELHQALMTVNVAGMVTEQGVDLTRNYERVKGILESREILIAQTVQERGRVGYLLDLDVRELF